MSATSTSAANDFTWEIQPAAAAWLSRAVAELSDRCPAIDKLAIILREQTGTRLVDWIDHLALEEEGPRLRQELATIGYVEQAAPGSDAAWRHSQGMFPPLRLGAPRPALAIRVESVDAARPALARALGLTAATDPDRRLGISGGPLCQVILDASAGVELALVERHGYAGFEPPPVSQAQLAAAARHLAAFRQRQRQFTAVDLGFVHASQLVAPAADELGTPWACDLFFTAEREYWQSRNHAARVQHQRQNRLGLGWANHDHHTYRSSRRAFRHLVAALEQLGFHGRERFYAGREAGWGAQVLEQPDCRIVIFADVDLSPEEVAGDFAHEPLLDRDELGTVGLWCELHGEAFLEAGMHHLECQFDFDAARSQLAAEGIETMAPFTDFAFLKQAFTRGEIWPVEPHRIARLLAEGRITADEADRFRREGAVGSHLEILQRNDGYKGFNQTGISEIISRTDPRRLPAQP